MDNIIQFNQMKSNADFKDLVNDNMDYLTRVLEMIASGENLYPWELEPISRLIPVKIPDKTWAHCKFTHPSSTFGIDIDKTYHIDFQYDTERLLWRYCPRNDFSGKDVVGFLQVVPAIEPPDDETTLDVIDIINKADHWNLLDMGTRFYSDEIEMYHSVWDNIGTNWGFLTWFFANDLPKVWSFIETQVQHDNLIAKYFNSVHGSYREVDNKYIDLIGMSKINEFCAHYEISDKDQVKWQIASGQFISLTDSEMQRIAEYLELEVEN